MKLRLKLRYPALFFSLITALFLVCTGGSSFAQCPVASSCTPGNPPSGNLVFGMGILNVNLNNGAINNTTPAVTATTGYVDYSCTIGTTLFKTYHYPISIQTNNNGNENVRVWLDMDNNGSFHATTELLFSSSNKKLHTGTFTIPATAVTGVPLRLRVAADAFSAPAPTPCSTPQFSQTEDYSLTLATNTAAPVAGFTASQPTTCSGTVSFSDQSQNGPVSWQWDFGDPGSGVNNTSALPNPTHAFSAPGTYSVSLVVSNANGSDTLLKTNYISYPASPLVAAACTPVAANFCCGNGITNVNIGNGLMTHASGNGSEGYQDFSCFKSVTVVAGNVYPIALTTGSSSQDTRIFIDLNNDGNFNGPSEMVFEMLNTVNPAGNLSIPGTTFINTPLRMRIISDEAGSNFTGCSGIQSGQAEDYAIIIQPNPNAPAAQFTSNYTAACDTIVNFIDQSTNGPSTWLWNFGDPASGAANTSTLQNPTHIYQNSGTYTVTLTASNSSGSNTVVKTNHVRINKPCLNYCLVGGHNNINFWITNVNLTNLNHSSPQAGNNYSDFTAHAATVFLGTTPVLSVTRGGYPANSSISAWIDFNKDGVFDSTEKVMGSIQNNNIITAAASISIPATALPGVTRLRIMAMSLSSFSNNNPCFNNQIGALQVETEDYSVDIQSPQQPPVVDFFVASQLTCTGSVTFNDNTINNPTSWLWDFGDTASGSNNISTLQNPTHIYATPGQYTVTLTATNAFGPATVVKTSYIIYNPANPNCSNIIMPVTGTSATATSCTGSVSDPGGPSGLYHNAANSIVTIAPAGAATVTLNFSAFHMQANFDFLRIYDGPSVTSPLLGTFSGTTLPNGGTVNSTGSALTLHFSSNGSTNFNGFAATWSCNPPTSKPVSNFIPNMNNVCTGAVTFQDKSANVPAFWRWTFGDPASGAADTSYLQNPSHTYPTGSSGAYTVTLITCNSFGCDTITKTNYINIPAPCYTYCVANGHNNLTTQWIGNVTMAGLNNSTGPEINGYGNYTYLNAIPMQGTSTNNVSVTFGNINGVTNYVAIWLDFNLDGVFQLNERVFNKQAVRAAPGSPVIASGSFSIPGNVQPGITRMRVFLSATNNLTDPCATNLNPGEVEDYLVNIQVNTLPPQADFNSDLQALCTTGTVQFTNTTINGATSWHWNFGDPASGAANTSTLQNPTHTYPTATAGSYPVTLIACKGAVCDTLIRPNYINVTLPCATYCPSYAQPNSNQWISKVTVGSISNNSGLETAGYGNYVHLSTNLTPGSSVPFSVELGSTTGYLYVMIWIDFNKDGVFQPSEQVFNQRPVAPFPTGMPSVSGFLSIPGNLPSGRTRMRIMIQNSNQASPCDINFIPGETEDYTVIFPSFNVAPVADFTANPTVTCNGQVTFSNQSTNSPTSWSWQFGDPGSGAANTSALQNPTHIFSATGTYTITLIASNAYGSDTITKTNYINYDPNHPSCRTITLPTSGTTTATSCTGVMLDDGGPTGNYSNSTNTTLLISPTNATSVSLSFSSFNTEANFDLMRIYDGPAVTAPLIGRYSGTVLPNGGAPITSTGSSLTVVFTTDGSSNRAGFEASWTCTTQTGIPESTGISGFEVYPIPSSGLINLKLTDKPAGQYTLGITNVLGEMLLKKPVTLSEKETKQLDLSRFAKGVYFIKVQNDKSSGIKKIVLD